MITSEADPTTGSAFVVPALTDRTEVWLVRHGQTQWSLDGRHTGRTDVPLTEAGRTQAAALRAVLADVRPALVLSSPRRRALDTAALAGLAVDAVTDDLAEWDYGDYEGRTSKEIHVERPGWTIFADGAPNGESAADVTARADRVLTRAAQAATRGPVVLVGHGHLSRVLGARWIGGAARDGAHLLLGTAAACVLGGEHAEPVIVRWNIANPAG